MLAVVVTFQCFSFASVPVGGASGVVLVGVPELVGVPVRILVEISVVGLDAVARVSVDSGGWGG